MKVSFFFQMSTFKAWLTKEENRKTVAPKDMSLTVNELENNEVAVKASNVFSISYSMLAGVSYQHETHLIHDIHKPMFLSSSSL